MSKSQAEVLPPKSQELNYGPTFRGTQAVQAGDQDAVGELQFR